MTILDLVTIALKRIGVIASVETPSAADADSALTALNSLIDQWQSERLQIYQETRTVWTIVSGTGSYTVGTAANVNVLRPVIVDHVNFQDTSLSPTLEMQLQPLTDDAYAAIPQKTLTNTYPTSWYYNPTFDSGFATLKLWPVPTSTSLQGVMYAPQAVARFTALTQTLSLPPGYERMLTTNLAVELCPEHSQQPSPALLVAATDSKAAVMRSNIKLLDMSVDAGALIQGRDHRFWYNIYAGP